MKALVTGASSGIGYSIARYLSRLGYDLIVVARRKDCLINLKKECKTNVEVIDMDLSIISNMYKLYDITKDENIDILVNNAGIGLYGEFYDIDSSKEIGMLNLNVIATDLITKLYLKDMVKKDNGIILNVSSILGFVPGPLMSSYYASKAYITSMSRAINMELKMKSINVSVSTLCAGAVDTNFNSDLGVRFFIPPSDSKKVAEYTVDKMLKGKTDITPGFSIKLARIAGKVFPNNIIAKFVYRSQKRKESSN